MVISVISDGVSRNLAQAVDTIKGHGLTCIELQFIHNKEVGLQTPQELDEIISIVQKSGLAVSSISTYALKRVPFDAPLSDPVYVEDTAQLRQCFYLANALNAPYVRTMGCAKQTIIFAEGGAEEFMISKGAWDGQRRLFEPLVALAQKENKCLLVETCQAGMITTLFLGEKLVSEINSPHFGILWDPYNAWYFGDTPSIALYEQYKKHIKHIHLKDGSVRPERSYSKTTAVGKGEMKEFYKQLGQALKKDGYAGAVSIESINKPANGTTYDGFKESLPQVLEFFC